MLISDWSSDVCSSDLERAVGACLQDLAGMEDELGGVGGGLGGEAPDHVVGLLLEQSEGTGGEGVQVEAAVADENVRQDLDGLDAGQAEQDDMVGLREIGRAHV